MVWVESVVSGATVTSSGCCHALQLSTALVFTDYFQAIVLSRLSYIDTVSMNYGLLYEWRVSIIIIAGLHIRNIYIHGLSTVLRTIMIIAIVVWNMSLNEFNDDSFSYNYEFESFHWLLDWKEQEACQSVHSQ